MKTSLADAEVSVRTQVDSALAALPQDFKPPADLRPGLVRYFVDQLARQMAAAIPDSATPQDILDVVLPTAERLIRDELLRRVNS